MGRFGLEGYRVLVTASTRGIGRGVAEVLLEEGAKVFICGKSRESVDRALSELRRLGEVYGSPADVAVREQAEGVVDRAYEALGGLDGLVYITGPPRPGTFTELDESDWEYGVRLLVLSAVWITRRALLYIGEPGKGSIVYLTSTAAREAIPNIALSNVLRVSIHGLVKTISRELGPRGVRVNAVVPGHILTDRTLEVAKDQSARTGKSVEEVVSEWAGEIPLRRLGTAKEVGYVVAFLLSPLSSYVTGALLPVDGGLLRSL